MRSRRRMPILDLRRARGATSPGGSVSEFCPQCGAARVGAFRFCRTCRLDFDALGADDGPAAVLSAPTEVAAPPPVLTGTTGRRVTGRRALVVSVVGFLGFASIGFLGQPDPGSAIAAAPTSSPTTV